MKKSVNTPRSRVRSALRMVWLRSRERAIALKLAGYRCEECGVKQSTKKDSPVKVEVHHMEGIGNFEKIIDLVFDDLLISPDGLRVLCKECHKKQHEKES
jgi:predicted HNH restriction endonuclease